MSKQQNKKQQTPPVARTPIGQAVQPSAEAGILRIQQVRTEVSGPLPDPATLDGYNRILPGAAERIMVMAEKEAAHRQLMESQSVAADIAAQQRQLAIAERQLSIASRSDAVGQILGWTISLSAIAGCIYLAVIGRQWAAAALVGLPIASIINAFRHRSLTAQKTDKQSP